MKTEILGITNREPGTVVRHISLLPSLEKESFQHRSFPSLGEVGPEALQRCSFNSNSLTTQPFHRKHCTECTKHHKVFQQDTLVRPALKAVVFGERGLLHKSAKPPRSNRGCSPPCPDWGMAIVVWLHLTCKWTGKDETSYFCRKKWLNRNRSW